MRHIFKIEDVETTWVSATSPEDAISQLIIDFGLSADEIQDCVVTQIPDDENFTVLGGESCDTPITFTCREWADNNKGVIACTVY